MKSFRRSGIVDGRAHRGQMLQCAVEERRLREHRDRRGTPRLSTAGQSRPARNRPPARHATATGACTRRSHSRGPALPSSDSNSAPRGAAADARRSSAAIDSRPRRTSTICSVAATIARSRSGALMRPPRTCAVSSGPSARASLAPHPESTAAAASVTPRDTELARPATNSAAPAFSSTTSRGAPRRPSSTASTIAAFAAASPPFRSAGAALSNPKSAGWT